MNSLPPSWNDKVRLARAEPIPPVNLTALLRALRDVAPVTVNWRLEFERLFASRMAMSACAAASVMLLGVAGWQAWTFWQDVLPWAQLIAVETALGGGAS